MDVKSVCCLHPKEQKEEMRGRMDQHLGDEGSYRFATVEERCVKIWQNQDGALRTVKKVNIKKKMEAAVLGDMIGFLIILSTSGDVLILNSDGKYVSCIEKEGIQFSSLACSSEYLYLGSVTGQVIKYHLSSLKMADSGAISPFTGASGEEKGLEQQFKDKVIKIIASSSGRRVLCCHENRNFYVYSTKKNMIEAVYLS